MAAAMAAPRFLCLLACLRPVAALPGRGAFREAVEAQVKLLQSNSGASPCVAKECVKPRKAYERILSEQPGIQWMDHGGYCGSWSIQRAAMIKGVWVSQQQVRNHTVPGGGNDNEILATNVDLALTNLKFKFEGFDYQHLAVPQADAYRKWIKQKLAAGSVIAWMIMLQGERYPVYPSLPKNNYYAHVEPVVGIMSDHPLNDTEWYPDDYVVHFTDADMHPYYRSMESLPDNTNYTGNCKSSPYLGYPCINEDYGFGWAIDGLQDGRGDALPASLEVSPSRREPDIRTGSSPTDLHGKLTVSGLIAGEKYAIYRWDSVEAAFDFAKPHKVHRFEASGASEVYADDETFSSGGSTYYRCIPDTVNIVV